MKKLQTLLAIILLQTSSAAALTNYKGEEICLSESEQNIVKTRIVFDNLKLAIRKCNLTEIEIAYYKPLENFFKSNDEELSSLYKDIYSSKYKTMLDQFITQNSNQASIKYTYNNTKFCTSYRKILQQPNTSGVLNKLKNFDISQTASCK